MTVFHDAPGDAGGGCYVHPLLGVHKGCSVHSANGSQLTSVVAEISWGHSMLMRTVYPDNVDSAHDRIARCRLRTHGQRCGLSSSVDGSAFEILRNGGFYGRKPVTGVVRGDMGGGHPFGKTYG